MTPLEFELSTRIPKSLVARWFEVIENAMSSYYIIKPVDKAMFLAQICTESSDFTILEENLNYSTERLILLFGSGRINFEQANSYGRNLMHPANEKMIANIVYGGKWGRKNLGNIEFEDGWNYRGRGLMQITGRRNYQMCGAALDLDLVSFPDILCQSKYAALSAAWLYTAKGCLNYPGDLKKITYIINGGNNGFEERERRFHQAMSILSP
ncbi:glycoside hydrolase family 19 protein [Klebsiella aerogenes]|uniref:glycoside hydrolase family 19 protein n=1 Tax=Klebsiella aerogenes TaxID=548 RepID=UPI000750477C|nr:glycoside hydrolase family 19 protein [Klebsiella aerogenes]ELS5748327.1 glycoside hydrolase family 19 protein [Klebsiella aerogenes]KUQ07733.1 endolysin [Klebsiella aerogenes]HEO1675203.1 glycoside hydrolase family 19 protein [Klebsiella aerogenes]